MGLSKKDRSINWYRDLTVICKCCGFPVLNARTSRARVCQHLDTSLRSTCQIENDKQKQAKYRESNPQNHQPLRQYLHYSTKPKTDPAKRTCLKCQHKFHSHGPFYRICPECTTKNDLVRVDRMCKMPGIHQKSATSYGRRIETSGLQG